MKQKCLVRSLQLLVCCLFALQCSFLHAAELPFEPGSQLPQFTLPEPDSQQSMEYLGLKAMQPSTVSGIGAKMVLVEFVSAMCPHCHKNAPLMNRLYKVIQDDATLAKDVKIIGICLGNDKTQAAAFKKNFKVPFPIFPDEKLAIAAAAEVMATPTMVLVTHDGKVLTSHAGVIQDFDGFVKELRDFHKKL